MFFSVTSGKEDATPFAETTTSPVCAFTVVKINKQIHARAAFCKSDMCE